MRPVERESFLKSFALFFISLTLLAGLLYIFQFSKKAKSLDDSLLAQMRLCSFELTCKDFDLDFVLSNKRQLYTLKSDEKSYFSYFPISQSEQYVLKFSYPKKHYLKDLSAIRNALIKEYLLVMFVIAILSALFSLYALYPLRSALYLTREFVRDILHDFNTPLASLRLNIAMLKREMGDNTKIQRIEQGIENTLALQENLRSYLEEYAGDSQKFELHSLLESQMVLIQKLYPDIRFTLEREKLMLFCNKDALTRIIANLLNNAAKYNKKKGIVRLSINTENSQLIIADTGGGIKNPKKIFQRFYTEHKQGVGIGLHIVKKLCDEMHIDINVDTKEGEGSQFMLDLSELILR